MEQYKQDRASLLLATLLAFVLLIACAASPLLLAFLLGLLVGAGAAVFTLVYFLLSN
jgi:hypothetical protein